MQAQLQRPKSSVLMLIVFALASVVFVSLSADAGADIAGAQKHQVAAAHISGGARFSCAIVGDATVRCWGRANQGSLGYGNTQDIGDNEKPSSAGPIDLGAKAEAISSGFYHTCAIDENRDLRCWGANSGGELGYGNYESIGDDETPASAGIVDLGGAKVKSVATGGYHTCVVLTDGGLRCWGANRDGQLGIPGGSVSDASTVADIDLGPGRSARAVAAGGYHTCAILDNGKVRCWGRGRFGQTGHATTKTTGGAVSPADTPYVDLGKHKAVGISAGYLHTCALLDNGQVRCWGRGISGQLGYGDKENYGDNEKVSKAPKLRLGKNQKAVAVSAFGQHSCAILNKRGKVLCWGTGKYGQLGHGNEKSIGDNEYPGSAGPIPIGGGAAYAIQAGGRHTCAVLATGKVRCWGLNSNGQLGYGNQESIGDNEKPKKAGSLSLGGKVRIR